MAILKNGQKLEFVYTIERYYGGKWHRQQHQLATPVPLPLHGRVLRYHDSYGGKTKPFRILSFDMLYVSFRGFGYWVSDFETVLRYPISAHYMPKIHELLTELNYTEYIMEILRYLGADHCEMVSGGVKYAL